MKIRLKLSVLSVFFSFLVLGFSFANELSLSDFDIENAREHIVKLEKDIADITAELKVLDAKEVDKYGSLNKKYKEVRWEIVKVVQNISTTTKGVADTLQQLDLYKNKMSLSLQELAEISQGVKDTKKYIKSFTRYLYKLENEIYDDNFSKVDDIKLFVKADNIATTLSNEDLILTIMTAFNKLMSRLEVDKNRQKKLMLALHNLQSKAEKKMNEYTILLSKLEQKKMYLIGFIKLYKKNSGLYDKFKVVFDDKKDVDRTMRQMITEISLKSYKNDRSLMAGITQLKENYDNTDAAYPLSWPIYPAKKILTSFKDNTFEKQQHFKNLGIQIESEQGSPVYSSNDGVVYYVVAKDNFTINWVVVLHPNNYVTVYSHLNSIVVKKGDVVKKGQLLGYSGGEPGTNGAGFASQGEGLWYYIFKNGVAVDPMSILDLSVVKDRKHIPGEYSIKFYSDKYSRNIDITDVKFAEGSTIDARAQAFLSKFAVGSYAKLSFWNRAVARTNIDRDVVLCIGFAESTLGRHLSTSNNIGNVGNDDSGNRIAFNSPLFGAMMIPNTLNNSHLGHYHTIKQLSRYGNKDGKVYASSPINWQTNVTKCLSQIKGYYVPEDFPFRTGLNPKRFRKK